MSFHWDVEQAPDQEAVILLSGSITEETDFQPIIEFGGTAPLRLDLAGIELINSCGVREWIHFVGALSRARRPFELRRCSPAIVRQLNIISNFRGGGVVRSVMLPYFCPACGQEEQVLLELAGGGPPVIREEQECPHCGATAEFDDISATYLSFVG